MPIKIVFDQPWNERCPYLALSHRGSANHNAFHRG